MWFFFNSQDVSMLVGNRYSGREDIFEANLSNSDCGFSMIVKILRCWWEIDVLAGKIFLRPI